MSQKLCSLLITLFMVSFCTSGEVAAEGNVNSVASPNVEETEKTFTAYYFHGDFRCDNCKKIEQYSREAIEKYFTEALKTKKLIFTIINTDLPENEHFIEDYQLYTRSLVIAEFKDGKQIRWKNLAKVWNYLDDRDAFYEYVKLEIQNYLEQM